MRTPHDLKFARWTTDKHEFYADTIEIMLEDAGRALNAPDPQVFVDKVVERLAMRLDARRHEEEARREPEGGSGRPQ